MIVIFNSWILGAYLSFHDIHVCTSVFPPAQSAISCLLAVSDVTTGFLDLDYWVLVQIPSPPFYRHFLTRSKVNSINLVVSCMPCMAPIQ